MGSRNPRARRRETTAEQEAAPLILDAGAIIALSRKDGLASALLSLAVRRGAKVFVPAVAVAETVRGRGPRDAPVNRVLATLDAVLNVDEPTARTAGELLGTTRSRDTIDALVVASAILLGGGRIMTGDKRDLQRLAQGRPDVTILAV